MLFNSIHFAIFLPIVFILYWFVFNRSIRIQNLFIVIVSYYFYGSWDWRFLSLIFLSTCVDYSVAVLLKNETKHRKRKILLWISVLLNLGVLGVFKYYNFFIENIISSFENFGFYINVSSLKIILPVGISFYTFQTLSYTIDVYKKKLEPTKDFVAFAAFVSFFPQLVAGPIERATNLLPQFYKKRRFNYDNAVCGLKQILWGLFKKVVVADNCAEYVNLIFNSSESYSGGVLLLGAIFFSFQIYGDFSGYSDIAIGTSRLLGFNLMRNFAFPYFSRDIAEFWRRWHISLSTWFRDYVYIPLGGSRGNNIKQVRNTFVIFILSGFWHGANWTFIAWGLLNALYFMPLLIFKRNRQNLNIVAKGKIFPSIREALNISITFFITVVAWVFFRAENISHAYKYISKIFSKSFFQEFYLDDLRHAIMYCFYIVVFVVIEWIGRENEFAIEKIGIKYNSILRWGFYYMLIIFVLFYFGKEEEFIYFQF